MSSDISDATTGSSQVARPQSSATKKAHGIKRAKKTVLPEDEYIKRLDRIIQHDYFPELPKLKAQCEYLDALSKNDVGRIRELQVKYSRRRTDLVEGPKTPLFTPNGPVVDSPSTFETPLHSDDPRPSTSAADITGNSKDEGRPLTDESESLSSFLAKHTSEDNDSFHDLMELEEARRRARHGWLEDSEMDHAQKYGQLAVKDGSDGRKPVDTWSYKAKNAVLWYPDEADLTPEEIDKRKKQAADKVIVRENTRFTMDPYKEMDTGRPGTKASGVKDSVDVLGNVLQPDKPDRQFLVTPSPMPGVNESPMMTWGEIEGTPFLLDAADVSREQIPGRTFKMPEVPKRDKLAMDLMEETNKQHRHRKQHAINQVTSRLVPKFASKKSMERLSSMSPAAKRLATSKLGIRLGTDKALRASYTPSPRRTPGGVRTPILQRTPAHTPGQKRPSLTANLLAINPSSTDDAEKSDLAGRTKAADFF